MFARCAKAGKFDQVAVEHSNALNQPVQLDDGNCQMESSVDLTQCE